MILFTILVTVGLLFSAYLLYSAPEPPRIRVPVVFAGEIDKSKDKQNKKIRDAFLRLFIL